MAFVDQTDPRTSALAEVGVGALDVQEQVHDQQAGAHQVAAPTPPDVQLANELAAEQPLSRALIRGLALSVGERLAGSPGRTQQYVIPEEGRATSGVTELRKIWNAKAALPKQQQRLVDDLLARPDRLTPEDLTSLEDFVVKFAEATAWTKDGEQIVGVDEDIDGVLPVVSMADIGSAITSNIGGRPVNPDGPAYSDGVNVAARADGTFEIVAAPDPALKEKVRLLTPALLPGDPGRAQWVPTTPRQVENVERRQQAMLEADPAAKSTLVFGSRPLPVSTPGNHLVIDGLEPGDLPVLRQRLADLAQNDDSYDTVHAERDGEEIVRRSAKALWLDMGDEPSKGDVNLIWKMAQDYGKQFNVPVQVSAYVHGEQLAPSGAVRVWEHVQTDKDDGHLLHRTTGADVTDGDAYPVWVPAAEAEGMGEGAPAQPDIRLNPLGSVRGDAVANGELRLIFAHLTNGQEAKFSPKADLLTSEIEGKAFPSFAVRVAPGYVPCLAFGSDPVEAMEALDARVEPGQTVTGRTTKSDGGHRRVVLTVPTDEAGNPDSLLVHRVREVLHRNGVDVSARRVRLEAAEVQQ